jgi:predicted XRE-type DNA-binding protein
MRSGKRSTPVQASSGNVFAGLGVPNPREALAKAELAHRICEIITARKLSQAKAAAVMGLDQPKISALMHGKLKGFSAERLFRCLNDLGHEVEITVRPSRRAGHRGDTRVITAAT